MVHVGRPSQAIAFNIEMAFVITVGSVAFLAAGVEILRPAPPPPSNSNYYIRDTGRDIGSIEVGQSVAVEYEVKNPHNSPIKVIGAREACGKNACIGYRPVPQPLIPPGGSSTVVWDVHASGIGDISVTMDLFIAHNGIVRVPLTVRGTAAPSPARGYSKTPD